MLAVLSLIALLPSLAAASPIVSQVEKRFTGQFIHLGSDTSKCLGVLRSRNDISDGYLVAYDDCSKSGFVDRWDISYGNNAAGIRLTGTNFCLDAGTNPHNNVGMKVWTCYPNQGLAAQTWYYTDDDHIAITGGDQCLDNGPTGVQTYKCFGGNTNQIWTIGDVTTGPTPPVTTVTSSAPATTTTVKPVGSLVQLHFKGSSTGCVTVGHEFLVSGSPAYINGCGDPATSTYAQKYQLFNVVRNKAGPITVASDPGLCLDAGVSPGNNGSPITVYTCLTQADGTPVPQQNWYYTDDNHVAITGGTQCLDVVAESTQSFQKPDGALQQLQTWQCSGPDAQQIFTV